MAININKPGKDTVNPPEIRIDGKRVINGMIRTSAQDIFGDQHVVQDGLIVSKREEVTYNGEVIITLIPDAEFPTEQYESTTQYSEIATQTNVVVGKNKAQDNTGRLTYSLGTSLNEKSDTYYTLNGKDPSRTKNNLYTGSFIIRRNTSGDNVVLKTRTYVQGYESQVRRVDLRIIGKTKNDI